MSNMDSSAQCRPVLERSISQAELEFEDFLREEDELQKKRYKPLKAKSTIHCSDYKYKLDCTLPEYSPRFANVPTVIVLVGLPARGKTYIAKKLGRYLNWISIQTNVFNVGEYRRKVVGTDKLHDFFRADNDQAQSIRRQCALTCLEDVSQWLNNGGHVALRLMIYNMHVFYRSLMPPTLLEKDVDLCWIFAEEEDSKCSSWSQCVQILVLYLPMLSDMSFIKIINAGEQYLVNHIEEQFRLKGLRTLNISVFTFIQVWTSQLKRAVYTAKYIDTVPVEQWKALDEMDFGVFDGIDETELEAIEPDEYKEMHENRFTYRYPQGEVSDTLVLCHDYIAGIRVSFQALVDYDYTDASYSDVCARLEPVIMELERQNDVLLVSHQPVIQILMAYFTEQTHDELPFLDIPLNTVFKLTPIAYGKI
ncbi:hypothetical protein QZH41_016177 [Actinostola sp. cb2023]|nr:hypothetical protein QZH41_016177 [Actinostola sp. cb2023]